METTLSRLQRILHVEDDPSISLVTRVTLQKLGGLEVLSCQSGAEALEKAAAYDPQLVLLDVMTLVEQIRAQWERFLQHHPGSTQEA